MSALRLDSTESTAAQLYDRVRSRIPDFRISVLRDGIGLDLGSNLTRPLESKYNGSGNSTDGTTPEWRHLHTSHQRRLMNLKLSIYYSAPQLIAPSEGNQFSAKDYIQYIVHAFEGNLNCKPLRFSAGAIEAYVRLD